MFETLASEVVDSRRKRYRLIFLSRLTVWVKSLRPITLSILGIRSGLLSADYNARALWKLG